MDEATTSDSGNSTVPLDSSTRHGLNDSLTPSIDEQVSGRERRGE